MGILTQEQLNTLIQSAMRDVGYKRALLENPYAAVYQRLGVEIPPGQTLHVVSGEMQTMAMIIPPRPADWRADLSVEAMYQRLSRYVPIMNGPSRKVADVQARLIAHAWHDERFRQRLLRDAKEVVAQLLNVTLPDAFTIRCFVDDDANQYLILPPTLEAMVLTDEQLEHIAKGDVVTATVITVAATVDLLGILSSSAQW